MLVFRLEDVFLYLSASKQRLDSVLTAFSAARGPWSICAQDVRATISSQWEGDLKKEFREYVYSKILLINCYTTV